MKKTSLKKAVAIALCASLSAVVLAGCGGNETKPSSEATQSSTVSQAEASTDPADPWAETVPLSIAMVKDPNIEDLDTNWFTGYLEEETNIDIEFVLLPTDATESKTKLNLMVSSGEELPDIINMGLDSTSIYDYGSKGIFQSLNEYYSNPDIMTKYYEYIPEDERSFIEKCVTSADGNIYSLFKYIPFAWNEAGYRTWIHIGWLNKVGKEMPTTTDELYDVLKAFTENDPNGNGKADEIGVVGSATGWNQDVIPFIMNAFLYANPSQGYFDVQDGKIIASFVQPEWRDGLEYMNKLVNEGLLDPLSFTQDGTQLKSLVNVEGGMAGVVPAGSVTTFDTSVLGDPYNGEGYSLLPPIKGPDGHVSTPQTPTTPSQTWFIKKDCENVERAIRVGDYFMEPRVVTIAERGEPDVDWSDNPEIMEKYTLTPYEIEQGYTIGNVLINQLWNTPQNKSWQASEPGYSPTTDPTKVGATLLKGSEEAEKGYYSPTPDFYKMYPPVFRPTEELIVKFVYTEDETQQLADIKATIDEYVKAQTVAFITGKRPLSDWDNYLKELENMQLQTYIDINQAAYDRF